MLNITLQNAMTYIGLIIFAGTVANCTIIAPLKSSIDQLQKSVDELKNLVAEVTARVACQETKIARLEEAIIANRRRIDRIERVCEDRANYGE